MRPFPSCIAECGGSEGEPFSWEDDETVGDSSPDGAGLVTSPFRV